MSCEQSYIPSVMDKTSYNLIYCVISNLISLARERGRGEVEGREEEAREGSRRERRHGEEGSLLYFPA